HVDLRVCQHSASALGEGGHRGAPNTVGDDFADGSVICDGQINGTVECDRSASASFRTVTACTVFGVQRAKLQNLIRRQNFGLLFRQTMRRSATREQNRGEGRKQTKMP